MSLKNNYFILFANCIPVKGAKRSIICDLQRNIIKIIPNSLYEILTQYKKFDISEIKQLFNSDQNFIIDDYFQFLIENEFGFWTTKENIELFPPLQLNWDSPSLITNAIIDINKHSNLNNLQKIFLELDELGCKHIQIRFFDSVSINRIISIFEKFETKLITSISLIIKFSKAIYSNINIFINIRRITHITLFMATDNREEYKGHLKIICVKDNITSSNDCGNIDFNYFFSNIYFFSESQYYNSCLNRKISIDINGEIRNCPSIKKSYGNIRDLSLNEVVNKAEFRVYWTMNKDQIEVCKDCEFRYACSDCRAFIKDPANIYSKPEKCSYNPYNAKWETNC